MPTDRLFCQLLTENGLPSPVSEYVFAPPRKWRFDYSWAEYKIALEVEGGIWVGGRHTRGKGFLKDMDKYNTAASMGWLVLRTTPTYLLSMGTVDLLRSTMKARAA